MEIEYNIWDARKRCFVYRFNLIRNRTKKVIRSKRRRVCDIHGHDQFFIVYFKKHSPQPWVNWTSNGQIRTASGAQ